MKKSRKISSIGNDRIKKDLERLSLKLLMLLDQKTGREKRILRKTIFEINKRLSENPGKKTAENLK
ncbi:MAG: hypothetical protein JW881_02160 [Spirochaetales bacterium]|nr:hypothetical protein [Spirochaetales bacterium]